MNREAEHNHITIVVVVAIIALGGLTFLAFSPVQEDNTLGKESRFPQRSLPPLLTGSAVGDFCTTSLQCGQYEYCAAGTCTDVDLRGSESSEGFVSLNGMTLSTNPPVHIFLSGRAHDYADFDILSAPRDIVAFSITGLLPDTDYHVLGDSIQDKKTSDDRGSVTFVIENPAGYVLVTRGG